MNKIILLIILIFSLLPDASAQEEFTNLLPTATAVSHGGSRLTYTDDPGVVYWNPGGLGFAITDKFIINITHPVSFNYIGFTKFFPPRNSLGFSMSHLSTHDDMLDVATLAYARRISQFFSVGANVNYGKYDRKDNDFVSVSAGLLLKPSINQHSFYQTGLTPLTLFTNPLLYDRFAFGLTVHNLLLSSSKSTHEIRIGYAMKIMNWGPLFNFGYHMRPGGRSSHIGFGFSVFPNFIFNSGTEDFNLKKLTFGSSISLSFFTADIAYATKTQKITFSLSVRLNDDHRTFAKRLIEQGTKMIKEGDFRNAYETYRNSLSYDPNNKTIITYKNVLRRKIDAENVKIDSLMDRANYYKDKKWYINATLSYRKVLEIDPSHKKAKNKIKNLKPFIAQDILSLFEKGKSHYEIHDLENAKIQFNEILQVEEQHQEALLYLGKIDSVNSHLSNQNYYRALGYYKQRHLTKAYSSLKTVLELNPDHEEAGQLLEKINREIKSSRSHINRLYEEAHTLRRQGDYLAAVQKFEEILQINQDFEPAKKQLDLLDSIIRNIIDPKFETAKKYLEKGDYLKAQSMFREILTLKPNHEQAKNYLLRIQTTKSKEINAQYDIALTFFQNGKLNEALRECERILNLYPEHSETAKLKEAILKSIKLTGLEKNGLELFKSGEYGRSKKVFIEILELDPGHAIAKSYVKECDIKLTKRTAELFRDGMAYFTVGKYEMAIREWNRLLEIEPNHQSAIEYIKRAQEMLNALNEFK